MADHYRIVKAGLPAEWLESRYGSLERLPQVHRRVEDRVAGFVREEPELVVVTNPRIALQVVHQVGPGPRAGGGSVNENDRSI